MLITKFIRILSIIIIVCFVFCLISCGNKDWENYDCTFTHAHFGAGAEGHCVTITDYYCTSLGYEIYTPEGCIFLSGGTYQLFESASTCPYCN